MIQGGETLSALLTCLEKEQGMTVTSKDGRAETGDIVEIHGDRAGVEERLGRCNPDWGNYLERRG